jgi:hypothetical protein
MNSTPSECADPSCSPLGAVVIACVLLARRPQQVPTLICGSRARVRVMDPHLSQEQRPATVPIIHVIPYDVCNRFHTTDKAIYAFVLLDPSKSRFIAANVAFIPFARTSRRPATIFSAFSGSASAMPRTPLMPSGRWRKIWVIKHSPFVASSRYSHSAAGVPSSWWRDVRSASLYAPTPRRSASLRPASLLTLHLSACVMSECTILFGRRIRCSRDVLWYVAP